MKIKFQADADFNQIIVSALLRREAAIDFQTADQAQIRGLPDPEVLAAAAREGRILVSHDHHTMPVHFATKVAATTITASYGRYVVPNVVWWCRCVTSRSMKIFRCRPIRLRPASRHGGGNARHPSSPRCAISAAYLHNAMRHWQKGAAPASCTANGDYSQEEHGARLEGQVLHAYFRDSYLWSRSSNCCIHHV